MRPFLVNFVVMINRVGDNQYTNSYTSSGRRNIKTDEKAPAFLLNYDEDGVVWDRGDDKKDEHSLDKKLRDKDDSSRKRTADLTRIKENHEKAGDNANKESVSIGQTISKIVNSIRTAVINAFNYIWYGAEKSDEAVGDGEISTKQDATDSVIASPEDVQKIESRTTRRKTEFDRRLAEAGKGVQGIPARNTDLLTTYDNHGKIRKVSATDSSRILKGDKSIKL